MHIRSIKSEKMVEVSLKFPEDLKWILESKEDAKFLESVLIQKLCEIKIGDILMEESKLKEKDIEKLDHLIKESLFKRIKGIE